MGRCVRAGHALLIFVCLSVSPPSTSTNNNNNARVSSECTSLQRTFPEQNRLPQGLNRESYTLFRLYGSALCTAAPSQLSLRGNSGAAFFLFDVDRGSPKSGRRFEGDAYKIPPGRRLRQSCQLSAHPSAPLVFPLPHRASFLLLRWIIWRIAKEILPCFAKNLGCRVWWLLEGSCFSCLSRLTGGEGYSTSLTGWARTKLFSTPFTCHGSG